ncbi:hypothetical protein [Halococcus thailandensis]|nr:hypothetical protein [Halococcus thailandensis]
MSESAAMTDPFASTYDPADTEYRAVARNDSFENSFENESENIGRRA